MDDLIVSAIFLAVILLFAVLLNPCLAGMHEWGPWSPVGGDHARNCYRCHKREKSIILTSGKYESYNQTGSYKEPYSRWSKDPYAPTAKKDKCNECGLLLDPRKSHECPKQYVATPYNPGDE
jgi:hypothetical protein